MEAMFSCGRVAFANITILCCFTSLAIACPLPQRKLPGMDSIATRGEEVASVSPLILPNPFCRVPFSTVNVWIQTLFPPNDSHLYHHYHEMVKDFYSPAQHNPIIIKYHSWKCYGRDSIKMCKHRQGTWTDLPNALKKYGLTECCDCKVWRRSISWLPF